jgi:hypothetical protein
MKWLLLAIVLSPFVVRLSFWALCTAKRLRDSGIKLSWIDRLIAYVLFAVGYPADFLYNQTIGLIRFGELRSTLYSGRIQYYVDNATFPLNSERGQAVIYWTEYLNICDPTPHIKAKQ